MSIRDGVKDDDDDDIICSPQSDFKYDTKSSRPICQKWR